MITIRLHPTMDPIVRRWYVQRFATFGNRLSMLPLLANVRRYMEPGTTAHIPHAMSIEGADCDLLLLADRDHMVSQGFIISPHRLSPTADAPELVTPVFNLSSEPQTILRAEIYSCIQPLEPNRIWKLKGEGL